jgi:hypothetical protein
MYHSIEFRLDGLVELEGPGSMRLQPILQNGTRVRAQVKPYVVQSKRGPIEVPTCSWKTVARLVPCASRRSVSSTSEMSEGPNDASDYHT